MSAVSLIPKHFIVGVVITNEILFSSWLADVEEHCLCCAFAEFCYLP